MELNKLEKKFFSNRLMRHKMFVNIDTLLELKLVVHCLSDLSGLIDLSSIRANLTQINGYVLTAKSNNDTAATDNVTARGTFRRRAHASSVVEIVKMKAKGQLGLIVEMTRDLYLRDTDYEFKHNKRACRASLVF